MELELNTTDVLMDDEEEEEEEEEDEDDAMAEEEEEEEPLFGPDPTKDTPAQRELRRTAARKAREQEIGALPDLGFGGSEGMGALNKEVQGDWMKDILAQMGESDVDGGDLVNTRFIGAESMVLEDDPLMGFGEDEEIEPDFTQPSTEYRKREMKGMLRCLSLMIRQYASEVEGEYILNICTDDVTGQPVMAPVKFKFGTHSK